jgi:hypothetical protein
MTFVTGRISPVNQTRYVPVLYPADCVIDNLKRQILQGRHASATRMDLEGRLTLFIKQL